MNRPRFDIVSRLGWARAAVAAAAVLLALGQLSCATTGLTPVASPMPAARAALRPEFRVFYDELQDYGDWVLIEPYGFVFRPKTRFNEWAPYSDGFWSPSDSYGWIWVSGEPYGWATYHYGAWINDAYQGYVWVPGLEWAPAWVSWTGNQGYVGWAAVTPTGQPAGQFNVVPRASLAAPDVRARILPPDKAADALAGAQPIRDEAEVDHVVVNRGPRIGWIEQVAGPLQRARVEDVPVRAIERPRAPAGGGPAPGAPARAEFRRVTESIASDARTVMTQKQAPPPVVPRVRLGDVPVAPAPARPARGFTPAFRDSTKRH